MTDSDREECPACGPFARLAESLAETTSQLQRTAYGMAPLKYATLEVQPAGVSYGPISLPNLSAAAALAHPDVPDAVREAWDVVLSQRNPGPAELWTALREALEVDK